MVSLKSDKNKGCKSRTSVKINIQYITHMSTRIHTRAHTHMRTYVQAAQNCAYMYCEKQEEAKSVIRSKNRVYEAMCIIDGENGKSMKQEVYNNTEGESIRKHGGRDECMQREGQEYDILRYILYREGQKDGD